MTTDKVTQITIRTKINAPLNSVWKYWTTAEDIVGWNNASGDWHTPEAENDLRPGGQFSFRMEAKDGSMGFDFGGVHNKVVKNKLIDSTLDDGRKMEVVFSENGSVTEVIETFETEPTHMIDKQRDGWQSILNNFKKYVETHFH